MPGMTDRDHFAAAALTGLLVHANDDIDEETLDTPSDIAYTAYAMADAMLRERSRAGQNSSGGTDSAAECTERDSASCRDGGDCPLPDNATNHDAAPAARARTDADRGRTDKADSRPGEGTGDTPVAESATTAEPVAWGVVYPNDEVAVIAFKRNDAEERATASDSIVPLYRHPLPTITDAEREAIAWAARTADPYSWHPATLRGLLERLGGWR